MAISQNFPNLNPVLNLNFSRSKVLDGRIVFSRSSTGTYFDSDGLIKTAAVNTPRFDHNPTSNESLGLLIEESRINLMSYSQQITPQLYTNGYSGGNIFPNSIVAPDGQLRGSKLAIVNGGTSAWWGIYNLRSVPVVNGTNYTYSCFLKAGEVSTASLVGDVRDAGGIDMNVSFTLSGSGSYSITTGTSAGIISVGNGWYRCWVTATADATTDEEPGIVASYSGNGFNGFYAWGFQFETGSFPTSFIPTPATFTSRASSATFYNSSGVVGIATTNVARDNSFFPDSTGVMRPAGLLLEPVGVNTLFYSEQFDESWWTKDNVTITGAPSIAAPDGGSAADKLVENATSSVHRIYKNTAITAKVGDPYTLSIFVKSAERSRIQLGIYDTAYRTASFNVSTGSTISVDAGVTTKIEKLANSWYRCSVGIISSTAASLETHFWLLDESNNTAYTGNGTNGLYIWGAQLESSNYPTSYIQTTSGISTRSADVSTSGISTRSADVATLSLVNVNSSKFTIKSKFTIPTFSNLSYSSLNYKPLITLNDGSVFNKIEIGLEGANPSIVSYGSSVMFDAVVPKQNLLSDSKTTLGFTTTGGYISQSSLSSPNGENDGFLFIDNATDASYHHVGTAITTGGYSTNFLHVVSVYAKKYNSDFVFLQATDTGNRSANAVFSFANPGAATQTAAGTFGTIISTGMIDCGSGWYRLYIIFNIGSVAPVTRVRFGPAPLATGNTIGGQGLTYTSSGLGVYFSGPQIERSTIIGKYISTTGKAINSDYYNLALNNKTIDLQYSYNNENNICSFISNRNTIYKVSNNLLNSYTNMLIGSDNSGNYFNGCIGNLFYYQTNFSDDVMLGTSFK